MSRSPCHTIAGTVVDATGVGPGNVTTRSTSSRT